MTADKSRVTIHMVSSLDGFIDKKDGSVSWHHSTDLYEKGVTLTEEDVAEFLKKIDCYVMGSHTYEHAVELGWPYGDVPVIVVTQRELTTDKKNVQFHSGDLQKIVDEKLRPKYSNIWMVGGSGLPKSLSE